MAEKIKRTLQVPHTYTIIFVLMILVAVLTWIVPSGAFDTTEVGGREVTVSGTYQEIDKVIVDEETGEQTDLRQGVDAVLQAPLQGIEAAVEVVAFIFIVGGAFQIITATGAIDAGMRRVSSDSRARTSSSYPSRCCCSRWVDRRLAWRRRRCRSSRYSCPS